MNDGELSTQRIYAWLANEHNGAEGLLTVPTTDGMLPLVSTDRGVALSWSPLAETAGSLRQTQAHLVVFQRSETLRIVG
jgi:hypothetical protein